MRVEIDLENMTGNSRIYQLIAGHHSTLPWWSPLGWFLRLRPIPYTAMDGSWTSWTIYLGPIRISLESRKRYPRRGS